MTGAAPLCTVIPLAKTAPRGPVFTGAGRLFKHPLERRSASLWRLGLVLATGSVMMVLGVGSPNADGGDPCSPPASNEILCENSKAGIRRASGTSTERAIRPSRDTRPTSASTAADTVDVRDGSRPNTSAYRSTSTARWYWRETARGRVATIAPSAQLPQKPAGSASPTARPRRLRQLGACRLRGLSPVTAVSGVYIARLVRFDTGGCEPHAFVVRDDGVTRRCCSRRPTRPGRPTTSTAGTASTRRPRGRAYKVSYNRPFAYRCQEPTRCFSADTRC